MGRGVHLRAGNADPIEHMATMQAELPDELALGAPVAVAKGVDGVQFAQVPGRAFAEFLVGGAFQVAFLFEVGEGALQARRDLVAEGEIELAWTRDIDCSQVSGPWVDVLKNVTVDGLEVGGIEFALQGTAFQFRQPELGHIAFER